MERDRRNRISELYAAALTRAPEERPAFLRSACAGDDALRQEVESLLQFEPAVARFLETPAVDVLATRAAMVNQQIGPYTIVAPLGAGGMGEVYRARDTKLGRDVALKMLPPPLTVNPERRARFAREARVLASLDHPHIGRIYGLEETDGLTALVLEFIDGPSLADRLQRGPLPIAEALALASQIAEALDAAHEKGVIHRDLKPANILLANTSGAWDVKVLDFGLAKALTPGTDAPAMDSSDGTAEGRIFGTPAYMSPEQARGEPVDARSDIWAFGCVLFEMLSGRAAFGGRTAADTLARVLEREPDWTRLATDTPSSIRKLLRRCLEKDSRRRLHAIADARLEIDEEIARSASSERQRRTRRRRAFATVGVMAVALAVWIRWPVRSVDTPAPGAPTRLTFEPGLQAEPAFSPDGRMIAYASNQSGNFDIYVKPVAGGDAVQVTRDPAQDWQPDWSPDGTQIVFRSERNGGGLYTVPWTGGPETALTNFGFYPEWSPKENTILFVRGSGPRTGMYTLTPGRGDARPLDVSKVGVMPGGGGGGRLLSGWHPDGSRVLLFGLRFRQGASLRTIDVKTGAITEATIDESVQQRIRDLELRPEVGAQRLLMTPDGATLYFLALAQEIKSVWKLEVDARTLAVVRGPDRVTTMTESNLSVALSRQGDTLAFNAANANMRVVTYALDESGTRIKGSAVHETPPGVTATTLDLTRDGSKLLFVIERPGGAKHVHDLREQSVPGGPGQLLLSDDVGHGEALFAPRWSPDGTLIAYRGFPTVRPHTPQWQWPFAIRLLDVRTKVDRELTSPVASYDNAYGWTIDGQSVIASSGRYKQGHTTIALVPIAAAPAAERQAVSVTDSAEFGLWNATMSPDGRWICFNAWTPTSSKLVVVSSKGGPWHEITDGTFWDDAPRWAPDGRFIYFVSRRAGLTNVWALRFDHERGTAAGEAFPITAFTEFGERIPRSTFGFVELGVGGRRLAIPVVNPTGGIWTLKIDNRR